MKDIMIGMDQAFTVYILAVSLLIWILFGLDKWKAVHGQWRIRENRPCWGCRSSEGQQADWRGCICSGIRSGKAFPDRCPIDASCTDSAFLIDQNRVI